MALEIIKKIMEVFPYYAPKIFGTFGVLLTILTSFLFCRYPTIESEVFQAT